ncbi:hypothetical protein HNR55_002467 [Acetobacter lovaniensis]|uniref:Uncharacterized protein n=1 Tax=Acetobacter lovaniensis TaxID=104100 RepID=A0A841QHR3_9PROT|nr:hypothetical protein [Acetobacter oeni]MBB6457865.1 hypothetical protein [Acetobacter lovaniensis]
MSDAQHALEISSSFSIANPLSASHDMTTTEAN